MNLFLKSCRLDTGHSFLLCVYIRKKKEGMTILRRIGHLSFDLGSEAINHWCSLHAGIILDRELLGDNKNTHFIGQLLFLARSSSNFTNEHILFVQLYEKNDEFVHSAPTWKVTLKREVKLKLDSLWMIPSTPLPFIFDPPNSPPPYPSSIK